MDKKIKSLIITLEEILIDNGKLDKYVEENYWNKITTNDLIIAFSLMINKNKDKICCLKGNNEDNE